MKPIFSADAWRIGMEKEGCSCKDLTHQQRRSLEWEGSRKKPSTTDDWRQLQLRQVAAIECGQGLAVEGPSTFAVVRVSLSGTSHSNDSCRCCSRSSKAGRNTLRIDAGGFESRLVQFVPPPDLAAAAADQEMAGDAVKLSTSIIKWARDLFNCCIEVGGLRERDNVERSFAREEGRHERIENRGSRHDALGHDTIDQRPQNLSSLKLVSISIPTMFVPRALAERTLRSAHHHQEINPNGRLHRTDLVGGQCFPAPNQRLR
ncbi:hypothetical protein R1flu_002560 [Riccia fluitans]|uniref:Uncharacterized protein n=1 Tax=Riccia fluitans TaxID=41844 RepID=A0ABD1Y6Z6_9MARC